MIVCDFVVINVLSVLQKCPCLTNGSSLVEKQKNRRTSKKALTREDKRRTRMQNSHMGCLTPICPVLCPL